MPAESRNDEVAAFCGDSVDRLRFIDRGQRSGNQARARETRRVRMEQERPARSRDDCVSAGLRDDVIVGPIIMPIYVYLPLKQETFLDLGVIMLGAGSTRFHAEQSGTLAGGRSTRSIFNCTPGAISSHTPSDRRRATEGLPPTRR